VALLLLLRRCRRRQARHACAPRRTPHAGCWAWLSGQVEEGPRAALRGLAVRRPPGMQVLHGGADARLDGAGQRPGDHLWRRVPAAARHAGRRARHLHQEAHGQRQAGGRRARGRPPPPSCSRPARILPPAQRLATGRQPRGGQGRWPDPEGARRRRACPALLQPAVQLQAPAPAAGPRAPAPARRRPSRPLPPAPQEKWVFGNFLFFRMHRIVDVYFVGGFGTVQWISVEDFLECKPDNIVMHTPSRTLQVGGWGGWGGQRGGAGPGAARRSTACLRTGWGAGRTPPAVPSSRLHRPPHLPPPTEAPSQATWPPAAHTSPPPSHHPSP
jgi:nitrate reductase NapE component